MTVGTESGTHDALLRKNVKNLLPNEARSRSTGIDFDARTAMNLRPEIKRSIRKNSSRAPHSDEGCADDVELTAELSYCHTENISPSLVSSHPPIG